MDPFASVTDCEKVLADAREGLGEHHPDTLAARGALAAAYRREQRYGEAGAQLEHQLVGLRSTRGADDAQTLVAEAHLAAVRRRRWQGAVA